MTDALRRELLTHGVTPAEIAAIAAESRTTSGSAPRERERVGPCLLRPNDLPEAFPAPRWRSHRSECP